ncbi:ATP11-domain-containing protein [Guyanagaster necrorhizus]|uniref:ATP11-domain-containing protein n=1 Tax=Guyanagaster necrorhizus TaxID=856835 RepID=A0A9P8AWA8_9AGAR|nr:ATP11-domain-containing protein [Guyanagaster necrorhizus MCA 3950]KAG7450140.1 ATP11-domain-containing protein [Guyanagaster necrorhizus MCA 3950]
MSHLRTVLRHVTASCCPGSYWRTTLRLGWRGLHSGDRQVKYAEKLRLRAEQTGLSVEELKAKAKKSLEEQRQRERQELLASLPQPKLSSDEQTSGASVELKPETRKDSAPVKPLSDILNLPRILKTTPEQLSALWTAYHASRSDGTGRGFLCAAIPFSLYKKMTTVAMKYPSFIIPLPRPDTENPANESKANYEFFFMQWDFHHSPSSPTRTEDPFQITSPDASSIPPISTVLFTPLQEYKHRKSFATPYLVLTHYTDLVNTHGIVLLRGEITPSTASGEARYMLGQEDAQLLAVGIQKFYLWGEKDAGPAGERLLTSFHDNPEQFKWEELLKLYSKTP